MSIEEAINYLAEKRQEYQKWIDIMPNPENTYPDICNHAKAIDLSIAALRAQQEVQKNEPLTLEELQEMDGEPVWLEEVGHDGYGEWDICYGVTGLGGEDPLVCFSNDFLSVKNYGVTWLAYRRKMKEGKK